MKKRIQTAAVCLAVMIAVCIAAACINKYAVPLISTTLSHAPSAETVFRTEPPTVTTKPETTTEKPPETTESTTAAETIIDINNLKIIDLYPFSLAGGKWNVKHCQGITVDRTKGYVYYSYTTLLVKCDRDGNIVGTVTGFNGHLGDISFNKKDGKVYCGYYTEGRKDFYVVIFNVDKITKSGMKATDPELVRTVHLEEVCKDYNADANGNGKIDSTSVDSPDRRFGCSGIDGVEFGPSFLEPSKENYLTVAYGIYPNTEREDNDYQVLLQYDVSDWWQKYAKPYAVNKYHQSGPEKCDGKYFVYTGNTTYGTQTISYFEEMNIWLLNCYAGKKSKFNKFTLFAVDGDVKPEMQLLKGQPEPTLGYVLSLYQDGIYDKKHDIYGWYANDGRKGMAYMGDGLFYIVTAYQSWVGTQTAICYLNIWNPHDGKPFSLAAGVGTSYSISKKERKETKTERKSIKDLIPDGIDYINQLF